MTDAIRGIGSSHTNVTPAQSDPARAEISAATERVPSSSVHREARQVADGDSFRHEAGLSRPQGIQDGDWLDDPRKMKPDQAEHLQKLLDSPNISDKAKRDIREFLNDWQNGVDNLRPAGEPDHPMIFPPTYRDEG